MKIKGSVLFRLLCIAILWVLLCVLLLSTRKFTFMLAFSLVASGIIVFVPLYKKYVRENDDDESRGSGR